MVDDIKELTVMFACMCCLHYFSRYYGITFEEMLSDNSSELEPKIPGNQKNIHLLV